MDSQRFDALTRALASGTSRRSLLKGLAASALSGVAWRRAEEAAARTARNRAAGSECTVATECASRRCIDGVCCATTCYGQCEACNLPGSEGICAPVVGAPMSNRPACAGSGLCGGTCDGRQQSSCAAWPGSDVACGAATCTNGWQTTYACDGRGSCVPTTISCGLFPCNAESTACLATCASDADCLGAAHCAGGVCQGDKGLGAPCTRADECQHGHCVDGVCCNTACTDQCSRCGVDTGGLCSPISGIACDDGDLCTLDDVCDNGRCEGTPVVCQALDQCHDPGVCDSTTGVCSNPPKLDGTFCDDGNACTTDDTCQQGVCTPGENVVCQPQDECHDAGVCNPASGTCSNPVKQDGTPCNLADLCTRSTCQTGACVPGTPVDCIHLDGNCVVGLCNPGTGACQTILASEGSDCTSPLTGGCTVGDTCNDSGTCVPGDPRVCTPSDSCHTATCQSGTGCVETAKPDRTSCGVAQICITGTCEACGLAGETCDQDTPCCVGQCVSGECSCEGFDATCGDDAACCSGNCVGGSCRCKSAGDSCSDGAECCSDTCSFFGCACGDGGEICFTPADCCSGICDSVFGVCSCRADGEQCESSAECCGNSPCVDGVCGCKGLLEGCESRHDCCSDICDTTLGQDAGFCSCLFLGMTCGAHHNCCGILPGCCNDVCVDMDTNLDHCGSCGNQCDIGTENCSHGHCCPFGEEWQLTRCCPFVTVETNGGCCLPGLTYCNGSCVSLEVDLNNCGECGRRAPSGGVCLGGVPQCLPGFHNDNGLCCLEGLHNDNGRCCASGWSNCGSYCADLDIDPLNCGSCGFTCESFPFLCVEGDCVDPF